MSISEDFTQTMDPILSEHYKMCLPFLKEAVDSVLPEKSNDEWLCQIIGKPYFDWDHDAISEAILVPMQSYLHRSGKLFRPYLVNLCLEAYNVEKEHYREIIGLAEIIHSASLMADDITDDSDLRRGKPTAHREFGVTTAGISSFGMFNISSHIFNKKRFNIPGSVIFRLNRELVWEHFVTGLGTGIDLGWADARKTDIDLNSYFDHILYRSCSYTYRMPLKIGALIAQAPEKDYSILVEFGQLTGQAFQLIDDILNVAPRHSGWGKRVGEDITAGKRTLLVLYTLKRADSQDRNRLLEILDAKTDSESDLKEAVQIMEKYNVFDASFKKSKSYIEALIPKIEMLSISTKYKSIFKTFAEYVICRAI